MHDTLCVCGVHVSLGNQGKVLGIAQQRQHYEITLEEHGETVELVPLVDALNVWRWRFDTMALSQHEQCRCIDCALKMYMKFGFGQGPHEVHRKSNRHAVIVRRGSEPLTALEFGP